MAEHTVVCKASIRLRIGGDGPHSRVMCCALSSCIVFPASCVVTPVRPLRYRTSLIRHHITLRGATPTLLWYTGTLRGEIAVIRNSPCEIAVFRPQNDHLARGIPDNGYFNPCFGAWRRLSGLGMVSLRSRGLSGLMPAGPHVWVTSAARGPTSRVSWLYAHISELPDDSSRIVKIPVVHAHHADRILRHALLAFPFLIHYFANFPA